MVLANQPSYNKRRAPNLRKFRQDKYHPNCIPQSDKGFSEEINRQKSGTTTCAIDERKVRLISHDNVRDIIVSGMKKTVPEITLKPVDYKRIKEKANFISCTEKMEIIGKVKEDKEKLAMASALRKKELREYDKLTEHGGRLAELEIEAGSRANYLIQRALELRQEQEDEIKKCNAVILGTKCHAIRDAQLAEKRLIEKEVREEEKRLEAMMEQERRDGLRQMEKQKEKERLKRLQFVGTLLEQIKENELAKEIEAERTEEESRLLNEAAMQVQLDDLAAYKQKLKDQETMRDDMNKVNQQLHHFADIEREENRLADLRIQEFMRKKAEREDQLEEEARHTRLAKEKELQRLRSLQEHAQDTQAAKDAMNAQRIQDEVEREWRRKEKEAAAKRFRDNKALKEARAQQIADRRRCQATEIQRDKDEAEKIVRVNQEALERDKAERLRKLCMVDNHRMMLLKQINEKEKLRIKNRQQLFEEGLALKMEQKNRDETLHKTMLRKMDQIRSHKVPEKYVHEVARQLKLTSL